MVFGTFLWQVAQMGSYCRQGPSDVLDNTTSEIASGSRLGIDAAKKIPGEGFKGAWPPLIKMDESVKAKIDSMSANTNWAKTPKTK